MLHIQLSDKPYQIIVTVISIVVLFAILSTIAQAYGRATLYPFDEDEVTASIYLTNKEEISISRIRYYLRENEWVKSYVSEDELDYILVLVRHLSLNYENINPDLIIAMIAVESRFDTNAYNDGARGLMQLLPSYHEDRLIQFLEDDETYTRDLFYDQRLNIMTGMEYMSYILGAVDGDVNFALMWYNQGAISASSMYEQNGIVSSYAKTVQKLANEIAALSKN